MVRMLGSSGPRYSCCWVCGLDAEEGSGPVAAPRHDGKWLSWPELANGNGLRNTHGERAMLYIVETSKDVDTAARDLGEAVKRNKFGVLHVHDLQKTLKGKGVDFPNACKILEV